MSGSFLGKPGISLTGFMFTGKSSVGRMLARRLGLGFVDMDEEIAAAAGMSIEQIFEQKGEAGFRELERETAARLLAVPGSVVSTGGGVVLDPENRRLLRSHSCVVWLRASVETVLQRFRESRGKPRPLLEVPDPRSRIIEMLEERTPLYSDCDFAVETDGRSVGSVVQEIVERVGKD